MSKAAPATAPAETAVDATPATPPGDGVGEALRDDAGGLIQVDPEPAPKTIYATAHRVREHGHRPIFPAWMRSRAEARALLGWLARYVAHVAGYHLVRVPVYVARLVWWAPRGVIVLIAQVGGWVLDHEAAPLRADAVERKAVGDYLKLNRERNARVRIRGLLVAGCVLAAVVVLVGLSWAGAGREIAKTVAGAGRAVTLFTPGPGWVGWVHLLLLLTAVVVLGRLGRPADRRITTPATVAASAPPRLTADVVTRALRSLGIVLINAKGAEITFPEPISRDGPGWRAVVDLPYGATPQDVMDKRRELASGLRRPLGCVWPEPAGDEHAGRLVLWVGDRDLAKTKQPAWPLARSGRTDLFAPIPFGTDQRGRVVAVTLMFASMVVGSTPRMGKTFSVRLLLLAAALDPIAELHLFELKGSGDFSPLAPVAHAYRAGDDVDDIEYAVADMQAVQADLRRRMKVLRSLPRDLAPENKITRELAERRELGLHPVVVSADECQRWFEHPKYGKTLTDIAEDLVRRGPAAGITAIFATQRPDAKSIPTGISGNAILRFCLKVLDHIANDQVLGTSAHRNGIKATVFSRRDLGIGWLSGEGDDPRIVRTYYVDAPAAEAIVVRARAARHAARTLSGYALGDEVPLTPAASLLDDLQVVFAQCAQDRVWSEDVVRMLGELRPELYAGWAPEQLAAAVKPYGLSTGQVWGKTSDGVSANRRGLAREDVLAAFEQRQKAITA